MLKNLIFLRASTKQLTIFIFNGSDVYVTSSNNDDSNCLRERLLYDIYRLFGTFCRDLMSETHDNGHSSVCLL